MDLDELNGHALKSKLDFLESAKRRFKNKDTFGINLRTKEGLPDLEILGSFDPESKTVASVGVGKLWSFAREQKIPQDFTLEQFCESIRNAIEKL